MLRVAQFETPAKTTLKLEGKLAGPWVDEVSNCWANLVKKETHADVELDGLSFVDERGTTLLLQMERQGSRLLGGSAFIHCLLHPESFRQAV
jgi:hypothetical protein